MALSSEQKIILVYGGNGAVGSGCVNQFRDNGWKVISVTLWKNIGSQVHIIFLVSIKIYVVDLWIDPGTYKSTKAMCKSVHVCMYLLK